MVKLITQIQTVRSKNIGETDEASDYDKFKLKIADIGNVGELWCLCRGIHLMEMLKRA